jgi:hypothetical protein
VSVLSVGLGVVVVVVVVVLVVGIEGVEGVGVEAIEGICIEGVYIGGPVPPVRLAAYLSKYSMGIAPCCAYSFIRPCTLSAVK